MSAEEPGVVTGGGETAPAPVSVAKKTKVRLWLRCAVRVTDGMAASIQREKTVLDAMREGIPPERNLQSA